MKDKSLLITFIPYPVKIMETRTEIERVEKQGI